MQSVVVVCHSLYEYSNIRINTCMRTFVNTQAGIFVTVHTCTSTFLRLHACMHACTLMCCHIYWLVLTLHNKKKEADY